MQISPSVRAAMVPDENPMHPGFTSIYLVGPKGGQSLTIDSGEAFERYQWFLRGYLAAVEQTEISIATITHHHQDHSGNLKWANEMLGARIDITQGGRPLLKGKIPTEVNQLSDGDTIDLGSGVRVQVLHTPGHSVDSMSYYLEDEGVLFTGDTLLGSSTTTVRDLGPYRKSLERLAALPNIKVICPGHGAIVNDPRERLQMYINHRAQREQQVIKALEGGKQLTSWEIMLQVYPDLDPRLHRGADGNVRSHLTQLQEEGRIKGYTGVPRKPNKKKIERDIEHAKVEDKVLKQAKKIEKARSTASLRAQENPSALEWKQAPRFELA